MIYLTKEGLNKLCKELEHLENIERRRISSQIAEAREKGDLSENAEYNAAKEAQFILELHIKKLKQKLSNVRIIDSSKLKKDKVFILSTVKIKNIKHGSEHIYTLVPEYEADIKFGKISINTPISLGLLGKKVGEIAHIKLPNNTIIDYEILEIK
ncbi:MAG: transcription elongation factor GreA [Candidatus Bostrichicola ureolyticus]|nr:MAG: transcription elongation factor GreA [Candidatus Bostrichicola ureolyticus]